MKKKTILITLATFGLLLSGLIGCGKQPSEEPAPSSKPDETSQKSEESSQDQPSSQPSSESSSGASSSSTQPVHEHTYEKAAVPVENSDKKTVKLMECVDKDDKYMAIAFKDYSAIDAAFDSAANASKYGEVDASIWDDAHMLAKTKGTGISWKVTVDKAIEGAKLFLGVTSTYASHGDTNMANQFSVKVNDADAVAASITGTYTENGLAPTKRTYLEFATINLIAGENTIRVSQESTSNRLLFGGDVRIHYNSDAKPVHRGYDVTFVTEHCKILVYSTKQYATETPVETNTCKAKDEEGNIIAYDVEDIELQPQVSFRVICDEGYSVGANEVKITGAYKNIKQGPNDKDGLPDATYFRITKVQEDLTITITPINGEQVTPEATFVANHCTVVVYKSQTISDENIDTEEHHYARDGSTGEVVNNGGQINFKVIPDAGYVWNIGVSGEVAANTLPFIALDGENSAKNFKVVSDGVYRLTKVNGGVTIKVRCVPEAGEAGLGYDVTFVTEHCTVLVYNEGQDTRFAPSALVDGKCLSRTDEGDAAKYVAADAEQGIAEVKPQVNFLVVCEEGYEFESGIAVGAEAKASAVSFITGNFNKLKNVGEGIYRITKIQGDLTVTITAAPIAVA